MTKMGATGMFMDVLLERYACSKWHSAAVTKLLQGAEGLATSPACAVEAMSWVPQAYSLQFHLEIEHDTVAIWAKIPAYQSALEQAMGSGAVKRLAVEWDRHM